MFVSRGHINRLISFVIMDKKNSEENSASVQTDFTEIERIGEQLKFREIESNPTMNS